MSTPTTFEVKVTKDDIRDGVQCSCSSCPVALAILRAKPMLDKIWVGGGGAGLVIASMPMPEHDEVNFKGKLPDEVLDWIRDYDDSWSRWRIKPISFSLTMEEVQ